MKLQITSDHSHTLFSTKAQQTYHSAEGAIMESGHVYIAPTFTHFQDKEEIKILEIGFGTGLNALLTLHAAEKASKVIHYETIEPDPIPEKLYTQLNYPDQLHIDPSLFLKLHQMPFGQTFDLPHFHFIKQNTTIGEYSSGESFDAIYYDAFSPDAQPEMWTSELFGKMYQLLSPNGILLTYSAKGMVKKALRAAGFQVKRLPGAGSKHHMLKAIKQ